MKDPIHPFAIMTLPLAVYGLAYGCAWYWAELRGWEFTPELMEFSLAVTIFYTALDLIMAGFKKYAKSRVSGIEDAEIRERKCGNIQMGIFILFAIIVVAVGWIILAVTSGF